MTLQEGKEFPGGYDIYVGTLATRIYHQDRVDVSGSHQALSGYVMREDSTGTSTCKFALSGHLVPLDA